MHAHVSEGVVDQVGRPPRLAYDGTRWWDLRALDPEVLAMVGWFPVTEAARPADTPTTTWDATYTAAGDVVTQAWVQRAKTPQELAAQTEQANMTSIEANLRQDLAAMQTIVDTANATIKADPQVYIKDLARALRRIDKMVLGDFGTAT
jgi:hypothetical protein